MINKYIILLLAALFAALVTYGFFWLIGFGLWQSVVFAVAIVLIGEFVNKK